VRSSRNVPVLLCNEPHCDTLLEIGFELYVKYCNVFDQRVARQQLSKHVVLRNNGEAVFSMSAPSNSRNGVVYDHLPGYAMPR
jgi:hypothetical protein